MSLPEIHLFCSGCGHLWTADRSEVRFSRGNFGAVDCPNGCSRPVYVQTMRDDGSGRMPEHPDPAELDRDLAELRRHRRTLLDPDYRQPVNHEAP